VGPQPTWSYENSILITASSVLEMATISNEFPWCRHVDSRTPQAKPIFGHICFCGQTKFRYRLPDEQENMMATTKKSLETLSANETQATYYKDATELAR